ncbi:MAG: POTRA domain-containing protein, partial [bacterium]
MRKILLLNIIAIMAFSLSAETISKITIRGNKKITSDAVRGKLIEKEGSQFNEDLVKADIDNVFSLGYFDNVDVYQNTDNGLELIFDLKEKPIVSSIVFEGNSDVETDDLKKQVDIKPYTVLNITDVKKAKAKLVKYYEEKGFYLVSIKEDLRPAPKDAEAELQENYLELAFKISENSKIKVNKITILGNKNIPDEQLRPILETKEQGTFSWFSGSGNYRESIVDIDRERIGYYYTTKGFPHVQVFGPITHVTPDKKWIYLTYTVEEGEKYEFGDVSAKSDDVLFTDEELKEAMKIQEGDLYNSMMVREQIITYQNMYGDKGYAFTNVVPVPTYHEDTKKVDLVFEVDKGRQVYFGKFKITGNNKTRDKVIRR